MGGKQQTFDDILASFCFLLLAWGAGRLLRHFNVSPILGEIGVGIIMGPQVLDLVPFETAFETFGTFGVTLLIFESGLHLALKQLSQYGLKSLVVAALGTMLPVFSGLAVMVILGFDAYPDGLSVGAALAPTSVGISLKLLTEAKLLDSSFGQVIVTAAFIDDILSIITLVVLLDATGTITVLGVFLPFLFSILFVCCGGALAYFMPTFMPALLRRKKPNPMASVQPRDEIHLGIMCVGLIVLSYASSFIGSHLLGSFMAGVLWSDIPRSMLIWKRQFKRLITWLVRIFFAATVAFIIPVKSLFSLKSFGYGMVLGVFGAVVPKLLSASFLKGEKAVVGWAMVARGEFAYLVAQVATEKSLTDEVPTDGQKCTECLMSQEAFAIVVWALLLCTIVSPFSFRFTLNNLVQRLRAGQDDDEITALELRVEGHNHTGLLRELIDALFELELEVTEAHIESDGVVDVEIFVVRPRGRKGTLSADKMKEIRHGLLEALADDQDAQMLITPIYADDDYEDEKTLSSVAKSLAHGQHSVEIRLMGKHHRDIFQEVVTVLNDFQLEIERVQLQDVNGVDYEVVYARDLDMTTPVAVRRKFIQEGLRDLFRRLRVPGSIMVRLMADNPLDARQLWRKRFLKTRRSTKDQCCLLEIEVDILKGALTSAMLPSLAEYLKGRHLDILSVDVDTVNGSNIFFANDLLSETEITRDKRREVLKKEVRNRLFEMGAIAQVKVAHILRATPSLRALSRSNSNVPLLSLSATSSVSNFTNIHLDIPTMIDEEYKVSPRPEVEDETKGVPPQLLGYLDPNSFMAPTPSEVPTPQPTPAAAFMSVDTNQSSSRAPSASPKDSPRSSRPRSRPHSADNSPANSPKASPPDSPTSRDRRGSQTALNGFRSVQPVQCDDKEMAHNILKMGRIQSDSCKDIRKLLALHGEQQLESPHSRSTTSSRRRRANSRQSSASPTPTSTTTPSSKQGSQDFKLALVSMDGSSIAEADKNGVVVAPTNQGDARDLTPIKEL